MRLIKHKTAKRYQGYVNPQDKRLTIVDGDVIFDYDPEVGGAIRRNQYLGITPSLSFNGNIDDFSIRQFYVQNKKLFERVARGLTVDWNGSNHIGVMDKDAKGAWEELQSIRWKRML